MCYVSNRKFVINVTFILCNSFTGIRRVYRLSWMFSSLFGIPGNIDTSIIRDQIPPPIIAVFVKAQSSLAMYTFDYTTNLRFLLARARYAILKEKEWGLQKVHLSN